MKTISITKEQAELLQGVIKDAVMADKENLKLQGADENWIRHYTGEITALMEIFDMIDAAKEE